MLFLFLRFFIFILLIWILLCFNNSCFSNSWNYKNHLEKASYLGNKRSLAECKNIRELRREEIKNVSTDELKYNHPNITEEAYVQLLTKNGDTWGKEKENKEDIEEKIDIEKEKKIERTDKCESGKFNYIILDMLKSNYKSILSYLCFILSFISCMLSAASFNNGDPEVYFASIFLINISIIIATILLLGK